MNKSDNWIQLGSKIQSRRKEIGLTQKQVAASLNISDKTLSRFECGDDSITVETLSMLSELLEVPMSYFVCHLGFQSDKFQNEKSYIPFLNDLTIKEQRLVVSLLKCLEKELKSD